MIVQAFPGTCTLDDFSRLQKTDVRLLRDIVKSAAALNYMKRLEHIEDVRIGMATNDAYRDSTQAMKNEIKKIVNPAGYKKHVMSNWEALRELARGG